MQSSEQCYTARCPQRAKPMSLPGEHSADLLKWEELLLARRWVCLLAHKAGCSTRLVKKYLRSPQEKKETKFRTIQGTALQMAIFLKMRITKDPNRRRSHPIPQRQLKIQSRKHMSGPLRSPASYHKPKKTAKVIEVELETYGFFPPVASPEAAQAGCPARGGSQEPRPQWGSRRAVPPWRRRHCTAPMWAEQPAAIGLRGEGSSKAKLGSPLSKKRPGPIGCGGSTAQARPKGESLNLNAAPEPQRGTPHLSLLQLTAAPHQGWPSPKQPKSWGWGHVWGPEKNIKAAVKRTRGLMQTPLRTAENTCWRNKSHSKLNGEAKQSLSLFLSLWEPVLWGEMIRKWALPMNTFLHTFSIWQQTVSSRSGGGAAGCPDAHSLFSSMLPAPAGGSCRQGNLANELV